MQASPPPKDALPGAPRGAGYSDEVLDRLVERTMPAALRQRQQEARLAGQEPPGDFSLGPGLDTVIIRQWVQEDDDLANEPDDGEGRGAL